MNRRLTRFDTMLTRHYQLTEREQQVGSIARSRIYDVFNLKDVSVRGFHDGELAPGSFLFLGLWHRRVPLGLGLWGMGQRLSGQLDCDRWHWFQLTQKLESESKGDTRKAIRRRLLAFPADLHGRHVDDPAKLPRLRVAETLYGCR